MVTGDWLTPVVAGLRLLVQDGRSIPPRIERPFFLRFRPVSVSRTYAYLLTCADARQCQAPRVSWEPPVAQGTSVSGSAGPATGFRPRPGPRPLGSARSTQTAPAAAVPGPRQSPAAAGVTSPATPLESCRVIVLISAHA